MLCDRAGKTPCTPTEVHGIELFMVDVPNYGPVELLGHRAESGDVVNVQRLMSEGELQHKLARMVQNAKNSRGGATRASAWAQGCVRSMACFQPVAAIRRGRCAGARS